MSIVFRTIGTLALCAVLAPAAATANDLQPASAMASGGGGLIEDVGAGKRVDLAGKLRMLSQRVPSKLCALEAGFLPEAQEKMIAAAGEFEAILAALTAGDAVRGVYGAETDRKVLRGVERLEEVWRPMSDYALEIADLGATPVDVVAVEEQSGEVLARAMQLVFVVSEEYSNPAELLQAHAITIDLAGRQRMLAQRMAKDACLLGSGAVSEARIEDLGATIDAFSNTAAALLDGMPEAGIVPPPSDEIRAGLADVSAEMASARPTLDRLRAGERLDLETRASLHRTIDGLTGKMNAVVGLYAQASNAGL